MVDSTRRQRLNLPVAPLVAAVIGGVIALAFALIPAGMLEDLVLDGGIAAVVPAAEPPLGVTARAVLILMAGGGTALIAWFGLFLLLGDRAIVVQKSGETEGEAPVLRRADAHPDAPARRPLSANRELGTPFLEVRAHRPVHAKADEPGPAIEIEEPIAERDLPDDLDTPLAAFDPRAIPEEPIDWLPKSSPLLSKPRRQVFDPGERFETFDLTPPVRGAEPEPEPEPAPEPVMPRDPMAAFAPIAAPGPDPVHAPVPIAAPEPMPAFAPPPARKPDAEYAPVPFAAPESTPAFAPTPAREPTQMFQAPRPFRTEQAREPKRPFAPSRPAASAQVQMDPSATIHALLDRLERGVGRRETVAPPPPPQPRPHEESLQEALVTLRRLATGG